jgi:hypothetical protein
MPFFLERRVMETLLGQSIVTGWAGYARSLPAVNAEEVLYLAGDIGP